jgi:hypothetical protein
MFTSYAVFIYACFFVDAYVCSHVSMCVFALFWLCVFIRCLGLQNLQNIDTFSTVRNYWVRITRVLIKFNVCDIYRVAIVVILFFMVLPPDFIRLDRRYNDYVASDSCIAILVYIIYIYKHIYIYLCDYIALSISVCKFKLPGLSYTIFGGRSLS